MFGSFTEPFNWLAFCASTWILPVDRHQYWYHQLHWLEMKDACTDDLLLFDMLRFVTTDLTAQMCVMWWQTCRWWTYRCVCCIVLSHQCCQQCIDNLALIMMNVSYPLSVMRWVASSLLSTLQSEVCKFTVLLAFFSSLYFYPFKTRVGLVEHICQKYHEVIPNTSGHRYLRWAVNPPPAPSEQPSHLHDDLLCQIW